MALAYRDGLEVQRQLPGRPESRKVLRIPEEQLIGRVPLQGRNYLTDGRYRFTAMLCPLGTHEELTGMAPDLASSARRGYEPKL